MNSDVARLRDRSADWAATTWKQVEAVRHGEGQRAVNSAADKAPQVY